jgi:hypothetical protein
MDFEHKNEIIREEIQDAKKEGFRQWKQDNLEDLKSEFFEMYADEFEYFCKEEYSRCQE